MAGTAGLAMAGSAGSAGLALANHAVERRHAATTDKTVRRFGMGEFTKVLPTKDLERVSRGRIEHITILRFVPSVNERDRFRRQRCAPRLHARLNLIHCSGRRVHVLPRFTKPRS